MKKRPARKNLKKKKLISRGNRKLLYRVTAVVLLLVVSTVFLGAVSTFRQLTKSFASALGNADTSYNIDTEQFSSLVYAVVENITGDPIKVVELKYLIFDKANNKTLIYNVPVDLKYDISGKFGEEELYKVVALGGLNSEEPLKEGIKTLKYTVLKIFGFKVDRILLVDQRERAFFDELFENGTFIDLFRLKDVTNNDQYFETDLSLQEFYSVFSFIKSLPDDRIVSKPLSSSDLIDSSKIDLSYEDMGFESAVAQESKSISILNGTNIPGIATLSARVVNNMGGRVVGAGNSATRYDNSVIVTNDPNSLTCVFLSRTFGITNIVPKNTGNIYENEVDRSDIVVILGFDTSERLY